MTDITRVRGLLALLALCTTTACGGGETVTVTLTAVAPTAAEAPGKAATAPGSPPPTISTAADAAEMTGALPKIDEEAGGEFAANMSLLTALCLDGSPVGYRATNDVVAAASTLIRIARRYPNATWNDSLGERRLPDAVIDVGEQVAPCYPDAGKRLTSAGKRLIR